MVVEFGSWKSERERDFLVSEDRGTQNPKHYKITENIFIFN